MKNVKAIQFELDLEGMGIVNYDSSEQRWDHNNNNTELGKYTKGDNIQYAKKNYYKKIDENGKEILTHRIKISSDCLKKNISADDIIASSPNIMHHEHILYNYITSPTAITRGYMFAMRGNTLKRKGGLSLSDAEQTCNAVSKIETKSTAGYREEKVDADSSSSNQYYHTENIGKISYTAGGAIDICALQLISADEVLDRYNFDSDNFGMFKQYFAMHFGDDDIKLAYNKLSSSSVDLDEYSIKLNDNHIKKMVKKIFMDILKLDIRKRGSYAKTDKFKVRLVDNPLVQTKSNVAGWVVLKTEEDIDNLLSDVSFYDFYKEVTDAEAIDKRKVYEDNRKAIDLKAKSDKAQKTADKKKVKETE